MARIFLSLFFVLPVCSFAGADKTVSSRLKKALDEGNVYAFRIELEKLLREPAKDFFKVINGLSFTSADFANRNEIISSIVKNHEKMQLDTVALGYAVLPPLGRKDGMGRSALQVAARGRSNPEVYEALNRYDHFDFDLYEWKGASVWDNHPNIGIDKEDIVWARLPVVKLEETAVAKALLKGDSTGFRFALKELFEGPAYKVISLLHSRIEKTGQTLFHLIAEFDPTEFESLVITQFDPTEFESLTEPDLPKNISGTTPEGMEADTPLVDGEKASQETPLSENIRHSREETARGLRELIEFVVPIYWIYKFDKVRFQKIRETRVAAVTGGMLSAMGFSASLLSFFEGGPLWGTATLGAIAIYGTFKCQKAFKQTRRLIEGQDGSVDLSSI